MYGIDIWSDGNFFIDKGLVKLNHKSCPSLLEITQKIRKENIRGPLVLRFPHLIEQQIEKVYQNFNRAIEENSYKGKFQAVFPLKVNQYANVIRPMMEYGKKMAYGLEAGSKAELILAMTHTPLGSPITVNGFKDHEMITLGFMAAQMGHNITLIIEGLGELEWIIEVAQKSHLKVPKVGLRVRLHSSGGGTWAKSGGMNAKFGLNATEILEAVELLDDNKLLKKLHMIHFHIGSQMQEIAPLKKALREAGNLYAELKKLGAHSLSAINIGGGLAIEYAQHANKRIRNYSLEEFSNDVVFVIGDIMDRKNVQHPDIYTESGRYIVAHHGVLITPVLELFSQDYQEKHLRLKDVNPPLVEELNELNALISSKNCIEYMHDALDHLESLFTLFDLGYIDLVDRSNAEILAHQIIKNTLFLSMNQPNLEFKRLQERHQERYLLNGSFFQSIPDYWGLKQNFPVMPLHYLGSNKTLRPASLWDITCDSDGEIAFDADSPLHLHDVDLDKEEYFLGFFNIGAYQETLAMQHNLFSKPNEATVILDENGFNIELLEESKDLLSVIQSVGYSAEETLRKLKQQLETSSFITEKEKNDTLRQLEYYLNQNSYLRTTN
ncbi:MAG: biosynthetic arginine decarboxylase [Campylobacterota bacterium]|nr:biosynthetic arginine decarboxylase [Campylobacterota bacterium]